MKVCGSSLLFAPLAIVLALLLSSQLDAKQQEIKIISKQTFSRLSKQQKKAYLTNVRRTVAQFEINLRSHTLAHNEELRGFRFQLLPMAFANEGGFCLVGGVQRQTVRAGDGRYVCPTTGRSCGGQADGFQCGAVYANVCVSRTPVSGLTGRCEAASASQTPNEAQLETIRRGTQAIYERNCLNQVSERNRDNCQRLAQRMTLLAEGAEDPTIAPRYPTVSPPTVSSVAPDGGAPYAEAATPAALTTAEVGVAEPAPAVAAEPDTGATAPEGAAESAADPAEADPLSEEECRKGFGIFIEGSRGAEGEADQAYHQRITDSLKAFGDYAETIQMISPPHPADSTSMRVSVENKDLIQQLFKKIEDAKEGETCEFSANFVREMLQRRRVKKDISLADYKSFAPIQYRNGRTQVGSSPRRPRAGLQELDLSTGPLTENNSPVLAQMKELKERCQGRGDFLVKIQVAAPTNDQCAFELGGGRKLSIQQLHSHVVKPLKDLGAKIVLQTNSSSQTCLGQLSRAMPYETCLIHSRSASASRLDSSVLEGMTYDSTYPHYLNKLKNPIKAHLCATASEVKSQASLNVSPPANQQSTVHDLYSGTKLINVGAELGYPNLDRICSSARNRSDFPSNPMRDSPAMEMGSELSNCPEFKEALQQGLGVSPELFRAAVNKEIWPGLDTLRELQANRALRGRLTQNCDIDLTNYQDPDQIRQLERRGVTIDRTQGVSH